MAHDVFISYSSNDKLIADAICAKLENLKIRCWIAPRDVPAGQPFAASIVIAIDAAQAMVLVLSTGSNQSTHVLREVSAAVERGIPIIPLRIDDVEPSTEMRYYIQSVHWLDAMTPPMERHLEKLANSVQALLSVEEMPPPVGKATIAALVTQKRTLPMWAVILIAVLGLGILAGGGSLIFKQLVKTYITTAAPDTIKTSTPLSNLTLLDEEWRTLSFIIPDETKWRQEDGNYTVIKETTTDTFAWSDEVIEGDFIMSAQVSYNGNPTGEAGFVVYGDGLGFSKGCLIFVYGEGWSYIAKDTVYTEGDPFLVFEYGDFFLDEARHEFTIEIIKDTATLYMDGEKVLFTFLPPDSNRQGRFAILHYWEDPSGMTYSDIKIKILDKGD